MAHVALFVTYNPTTASKVGEIFNENVKVRASARIMKSIFGPIDWLDQDGSHSISVFEVAEDKYWDGVFELTMYMRPYMAIEGYRYETKPVFTPEDMARYRKMIADADAKVKK